MKFYQDKSKLVKTIIY